MLQANAGRFDEDAPAWDGISRPTRQNLTSAICIMVQASFEITLLINCLDMSIKYVPALVWGLGDLLG